MLVYCHVGILSCWCIVVLMYCCVDVLSCWCIVMLVYCGNGVLLCFCFLLCWCIAMLVYCCVGVLSCWCIIVLVYCWMYIPDLPIYFITVFLLCCYVVVCTYGIYQPTWYSTYKPHVGTSLICQQR
jgi:hypothetical protein